jgi:hypothetical protein
MGHWGRCDDRGSISMVCWTQAIWDRSWEVKNWVEGLVFPCPYYYLVPPDQKSLDGPAQVVSVMEGQRWDWDLFLWNEEVQSWRLKRLSFEDLWVYLEVLERLRQLLFRAVRGHVQEGL